VSQYEVRAGYYGGLKVTSEMIKAQRFNIEMEQHYRQQREDHELLMHAMKLKSMTNQTMLTLATAGVLAVLASTLLAIILFIWLGR
jgi:hypothetical protein